MEKVLNYSRAAVGAYDGVAQTRSWDCGPASAQVILQACGINVDEQTLINQIGTTVNGTNHAGLIAPVLDGYLKGSGYSNGVVWLTKEPVSQNQIDNLWKNTKRSIDAGRGVIFNFEAPPNNFPRGTRGSVSPNYRGWNTIYHYVACMGYAQDDDGSRHFWIADPGFYPFGYWISLEQVASLIVPHAYAYAADAPILAQKIDDPKVTPPVVPPPVVQPEIAALTAKVEKLTTALVSLLTLLEKANPDLLRQYIDSTKGAV